MNACFGCVFTNNIRALIQIPARRTVYTTHNNNDQKGPATIKLNTGLYVDRTDI